VISHSFAFNASRHLSTLVRMLALSPPLPVFLLFRVGGLSRLNTRTVRLDIRKYLVSSMEPAVAQPLETFRTYRGSKTRLNHRCQNPRSKVALLAVFTRVHQHFASGATRFLHTSSEPHSYRFIYSNQSGHTEYNSGEPHPRPT
jgi:hypothetical protein